jgi:hypothetical protein
MAGVIEFSGQTEEAKIQPANVLIVCMNHADMRNIRDRCPFEDSIRPAFFLGKDPHLKRQSKMQTYISSPMVVEKPLDRSSPIGWVSRSTAAANK